MAHDEILTSVDDDVLTITMHRPDRLNAWTPRMSAEMIEAIVEANDDPSIIAIVVTGAGRGFCAGADMEVVFQDQLDGVVEAPAQRSRDWVGLMRESKPIIAAINGPAIGVGLSQTLSMDHLIAAEGAKLSLRFVKMGVVPELASSVLVPLRVGFGRASELMLTGRTLLAEEAVELGLIDRVVPADSLLEAAHEMAHAMGDNPQASLAFTKQLLTQNLFAPSLAEAQRLELSLLGQAYETPEHKEAVAAFLGKREPDFQRARQRE